MQFDIDPKPDEAQRACIAIARAVVPAGHSQLIVVAVYAAVAVGAFFFTRTTAFATTVIGVLAVMAALTLLQLDLRSRGRRAQARDPHALETHHVALSAEGVRTWCAHVDARYPWTDFSRVVETPEFVLFARPSGAGVAIPQRLLNTTSASEMFERVQAWAPALDITRAAR